MKTQDLIDLLRYLPRYEPTCSCGDKVSMEQNGRGNWIKVEDVTVVINMFRYYLLEKGGKIK